MKSKLSKVQHLIEERGSTFLGAGPMSINCINVVIDLANEFSLPIALIPSRRQIECESLGGGYVENWTTEVFAAYVKSRDIGSNIILSRDHCGPWQIPSLQTNGNSSPLEMELENVKTSLKADISSGFEFIHIDSSLGFQRGLDKHEVREIALDLIEYCESIKIGELHYEIGTEEQEFAAGGITEAVEELQVVLEHLSLRGLPKPVFYVQQTGTKVQEIRNVGNFDHHIDSKGILPASVHLPMILKACKDAGVWLKEHNADYISTEAISWHPRFGIHAANVAPEFGVEETKTLIQIAKSIGDSTFLKEFTINVVSRERWRKWMLPNSNATEYEKLLIAGHYHFSDEWFKDLRGRLFDLASNRGVDAQSEVTRALRISLLRYLEPFGYSL